MDARIKLITCCILVGINLVGVNSAVHAATMYDSDYTNQIHGYMPYIPSVGPYLYQAENPNIIYKAAENNGIKANVKVGDILEVPTQLKESAYSLYYSWGDKDGDGAFSDIEDKKNINLSFEWYLMKENSPIIIPGINAELLDSEDGVISASENNGPKYFVGTNAVGKNIGFRIKAYSEKGLPNEGVYLDVPNIAYLGKQVSNDDPSILPETLAPNPDDQNSQHPDIADNVVLKGDDYIIRIKDITLGEANGEWLLDTQPVYVKHSYKAYVQKWNEETGAYQDVTDEMDKYLSWNLYSVGNDGNLNVVYEYMTHLGIINNIPTEPNALMSFNPDVTPFTYDLTDKQEIESRFIQQNNKVFKLQLSNDDALPKTRTLAPNYSEQSLQLKVKLIVP